MLRLNGIPAKEKESSEKFANMVKEYNQHILKVELNDNEFNCIHRISQKYGGYDGKTCL